MCSRDKLFFVTNSKFRSLYTATFLLNEQLANLIRDYCVMHVERNDAEMDHACGYKRGVAGPNPIAKWRRHLKIRLNWRRSGNRPTVLPYKYKWPYKA